MSEVLEEINDGWCSTMTWCPRMQSLGFSYEETRFGWSGFRTPGCGRRRENLRRRAVCWPSTSAVSIRPHGPELKRGSSSLLRHQPTPRLQEANPLCPRRQQAYGSSLFYLTGGRFMRGDSEILCLWMVYESVYLLLLGNELISNCCFDVREQVHLL